MSHLFFYSICCTLLLSLPLHAQKTWDGEGGDGEWGNPVNWSDNTLPAVNDIVILDNSVILSDYTVKLPGGELVTTVRQIIIDPSGDEMIELILPSTSTAIPALVITGSLYGLIIHSNGVFRNSSGASSGTPVSISDSIQINNGGKYVHHTQRAHTSNIQVLSAAPGTEKGIMEFDVPDVSSTISLSGRIFGRLVMKSQAAGGTLIYTAAGTNKVFIRDDLEIGEGVTLGLHFSDTITIYGDLLQHGGVFNLSNSTRTVVVRIHGNIQQSPSAAITETGTGEPVIELISTGQQQVDIKGIITNSVSLVKNGNGSAVLGSPLSLPYKLSLRQGKIVTSAQTLLTLLSSCTIEEAAVNDGFIEGPLKKEGLNHSFFLFPVGSREMKRAVELENATGDFTVVYHRADPYQISSTMGEGIDHVSHLEYWDIFPHHPAQDMIVTLSFDHTYSGGVTDLAHLSVARLINNKWENAGNSAFTGSAGASGWVSSFAAGGFSAENHFFALASTIGQENPLPFSDLSFKAVRKDQDILFQWNVPGLLGIHTFRLEGSSDGILYSCIDSIVYEAGKIDYRYTYHSGQKQLYYFRLQTIDDYGELLHVSRVIQMRATAPGDLSINSAFVMGSDLVLKISAPAESVKDFFIFDHAGRVVKKTSLHLYGGVSDYRVALAGFLERGIYHIVGASLDSRTNTYSFIIP